MVGRRQRGAGADRGSMSRTYRNGVGELAPGLVLPADYQKRLRSLLAAIEEGSSLHNTENAQMLARGVVMGLELAKSLPAPLLETLHILIDNAATARLLELERDSGA